jgi:hypothetical protein
MTHTLIETASPARGAASLPRGSGRHRHPSDGGQRPGSFHGSQGRQPRRIRATERLTGRMDGQRNELVPSTGEERAVPSKRDQIAPSHLPPPAGQKASFAGSGVKVADASQLPPPQEELALYCDANPFLLVITPL